MKELTRIQTKLKLLVAVMTNSVVAGNLIMSCYQRSHTDTCFLGMMNVMLPNFDITSLCLCKYLSFVSQVSCVKDEGWR